MTNVAETSVIAYQGVKRDLGQKQEQVLAVFNFPLTNAEAARALGWAINRVTPRVFELRKMEFLVQAGIRKCSVTGHLAQTWIQAKKEIQDVFF